jgi:hypothetical protein
MVAAAVALAVGVAEGAEGVEWGGWGVKRKGLMICKQAAHVPVGIA